MSIDASKLRVELEGGERCRRCLRVTVPAAIVEVERANAIRKLASRLKLPGFRKGRIPQDVVERRYGRSVERDVLDQVIGEAYPAALALEELQPISEGEVDEVRYEPGEDLVFAISFDVQPEIRLGRVGGFSVRRPQIAVGEAEKERILERLRHKQGVWRPEEEGPAREGDLVAVTIRRRGEEEAEPQEYEFVLGRGDAIPDVEEAILTLSPNGTGNFTVAFPADFPDEEKRGRRDDLRITLTGRKIREMPPLDDDFAKSLGDFETLAELKGKIATDLEARAREEMEDELHTRLLNLVIEANPFQVPESMVRRYTDSVLEGMELGPEEREKAREAVGPSAEGAVMRLLIIDRLAETQGLVATEEEVDARVRSIAERNDIVPEKLRAQLGKEGGVERLERDITERKVFAFLKDQSSIIEPAESGRA